MTLWTLFHLMGFPLSKAHLGTFKPFNVWQNTGDIHIFEEPSLGFWSKIVLQRSTAVAFHTQETKDEDDLVIRDDGHPRRRHHQGPR